MDPAKMKSVLDNSAAIQDYVKNLKQWELDMKKEDQRLLSLKRQRTDNNKEMKNHQKKLDNGAKSDSKSKEDEYELRKLQAVKLKDEGNSLYSSGKFTEAIEHYTKGIKLDPANHILFANRAMCYIKIKRFKEAVTDCSECLNLSPGYLKAFLRRGSAYFHLGLFQHASDDYSKALELEPWNTEAKQMVAEIRQKVASKDGAKKSAAQTRNKVVKTSQNIVKKEQHEAIKSYNNSCSKQKESESTSVQDNNIELKRTANENDDAMSCLNLLSEEICGKNSKSLEARNILRTEISQVSLSRLRIQEVEKVSDFLAHKFPLRTLDAPAQKSPTSSTCEILSTKPANSEIKKTVKSLPCCASSDKPTLALPPLPRTSHQFCASWKKISANLEIAIKWLQDIPASRIRNMEMEVECLESIFATLCAYLKTNPVCPDKVTIVRGLLQNLVLNESFSLNMLFFSSHADEDIFYMLDILERSAQGLPSTLSATRLTLEGRYKS